MPIRVVNKYKHTPTETDVYIGRGSVLGNPFTGSKDLPKTKAKYQVANREEAVAAYKDYLYQEIANDNVDFLTAINTICELGSGEAVVNLICFCAPKACHGDIIKGLCDEIINLRKK